MSVFVTLHDLIEVDDLEDVLSMAIEKEVVGGLLSGTRVVASYGRLPSGWVAKTLPHHVKLFNVPLADAELLRASTAFALGEAFNQEISVDEHLDSASRSVASRDELNLARTEMLLSSGFPRPASELAGATRRYLQDLARPFPASLAESIGWYMLLSDYVERTRTPIFHEDGNVLCKRGIDTDIAVLVKAHQDDFRQLLQQQPVFGPSLDGQIKFLGEGANLLKVAFKNNNPQYSLFVWLAIYFLRVSYLRYSVNDTAEAIALLVRSLECYATYFLAEDGAIRFESGSFVWNADDSRVLGSGDLWGRLSGRIDSSLVTALASEISAVEEVIKLRNRSLYGHGVQKIAKKAFEFYYSGVRRLLENLEDGDEHTRARWEKLWALSVPPCLTLLKTLIRKALGEFQFHGELIG